LISTKSLALAQIALAALGLSSSLASRGPDAERQARKTLEASAQAYRRVAGLKDTLTYVIKTASGVQPSKTLEIRLGAGQDVAVNDALFDAIALNGKLYLTKSDAPDKYIAQPYSGDFAKSLEAIVGAQGWPFEPLQIAMRLGKDVEGWLNALRFGQLGTLKISGYEKKAIDGRSVDAINFTADNGRIEADFDSTTHFLSRVFMRAHPPGAPADAFIEVVGQLSPKVLESPKGLVAFDPGDRLAVVDVTSLDSTRLRTGEPAPSFDLEKLTGARVALSELKGSVVVLDFWASWCAPCWKTLHETQRLADWAAQSGMPVAIFAVNTLEDSPTVAEKKDRATRLFQSQGLKMTCLLDLKNELFHAFGSPGLPSMIVIASDGTVFKYHQGLFPDMQEVVKREIKEASSAVKHE
jgi:peroxiredoxin